MSCYAGFVAQAHCCSRADKALAVMIRGSVGTLMAGFDVQTESCVVLPRMEPVPISQWQPDNVALYDAVYKVLGKNDVLNQKGAKGTILNRWSNKFSNHANAWHHLLDGSPTEILSRIMSSGLPFHALPCGSLKAEEWCKAHVPSVLCLLYRGLPPEKQSPLGEEKLLDSWKQHVLRALKSDVAESGAHPHIAIANFDEFTSTRWILQPEEKHREEPRHLDVVRVVRDMRELLFSHELYLAAMKDLHPGLMADIAGRWFCDYYALHGSAGFFTGNNVGRYIADILNPYQFMSEQHKKLLSRMACSIGASISI